MYHTDAKDFIKASKRRKLKKTILRYNEYYQMQIIFDNLYKQSQQGSVFHHLYEIITSQDNILLAYRTIKRNDGSKTPGTNRHNIRYWEKQNVEDYISYMQNPMEE